MGPEPPALTVGTPIRDIFPRYELPWWELFRGLAARAESIQMVWEQLLYFTSPHPANKAIGVQSILMGVGR